MKQKIVIKVSMNDNKSRSKALQTAFTMSGIESAAIIGADKNQVQVVGEGIDSVRLTQLLRKNVTHADLVSVGEDKKPEAEAPAPQLPVIGWYNTPPPVYNGHPYYNQVYYMH